jgi:CBS domain containing-hemolysin-like protein
MSGWFGLGLIALLIVGNGVFVAAEFAMVSVRRTRVEELAAAGDRRARVVARQLSDLSFTLSAAQFGITVTSLLVGYVAARTVGERLIRPLLDLAGLPEQAVFAVTVTGAFLLATVVQMVAGELVPKNVAISRPLAVALLVAPFSRGFALLLGPVVRVFHASARLVTEQALRIEVARELAGGHSLDELSRIIAASGQEGSLTEEQAALLSRAAGLGDRRVTEVMVPRPDVAWLAADDDLTALRAASRRTGHSRFPVRGATEDEVLGTVHVKDLLRVPPDAHPTTTVASVAAPVFAVPESETLRQLLAVLRREHRTFAVVVDEYGGTAGIVTVEDVLEELVGDIEDEFDPAGHDVRRIGAGRHLVRGSTRIDRIEQLLDIELPEGEYETVAGFVLDRLGHIPEPGEYVDHDGRRFTVVRLEGVRIIEVSVEGPGDRRTSPRPPRDRPGSP